MNSIRVLIYDKGIVRYITTNIIDIKYLNIFILPTIKDLMNREIGKKIQNKNFTFKLLYDKN